MYTLTDPLARAALSPLALGALPSVAPSALPDELTRGPLVAGIMALCSATR
jgi:hypothetical protein